MIDALADANRLVVDARLRPVIGSTFQPTGFANLGAAEFRRPGGPPSLLVESVQSMTNHFEALGFDAAARRPIDLLERLPWIAVVGTDSGEHLTSSREEPHRLAAAYVRDAAVDGERGLVWLAGRLGLRPRAPLDWPSIYASVFQLDPLCLLHGVFFSDKGFHGNPKVRRALSAVIEAHDVVPVVSGGLKRDDVQFTSAEGQGAEEGYGFVPFGRTEYSAREIVLSASLDLAQLRGYGLGPDATRLLTLLAIWELRALLDGPLRLRTACDLEVEDVAVRRPDGYELPAVTDLERAIEAADVAFDEPGARRGTWPAPKAA
jgi:CRISPR-associated protein Csb1